MVDPQTPKDDTEHLQSSPPNAERLTRSVAAVGDPQLVEKALGAMEILVYERVQQVRDATAALNAALQEAARVGIWMVPPTIEVSPPAAWWGLGVPVLRLETPRFGLVPPKAPEPDDTDAALLDWLDQHPQCEVSHDPWSDEPRWRVHLVSGGRNDREWGLVGEADTAREALRAGRERMKTLGG